MSGRPRTPIGTFGQIAVVDLGGRYRAMTRVRDLDGRLRKVTATAPSSRAAQTLLKERLANRHGDGHGVGGVLDVSSGFDELCQLWLADLALRDISEGTKQNYRDDLRRYVRPAFEHYTLGEITTGRVEWFLRREAALSYGRAKHTRTLLNQLFAFALRHDAITRNPVEGTSKLIRPKHEIHAITLEQVQTIRVAAAAWRTGPDIKGPARTGRSGTSARCCSAPPYVRAKPWGNDAPAWSQGRTASPGCVMAPWGASVNGADVTIDGPTVIDARQVTSGCAGVALQQMTLHVAGDVTIYADKFTSINGLKVLSADGAAHRVSLLIPGSQPSCGRADAIDLSANTTFDPLLAVQLASPGSVVLHDRSSLSGTVNAGCLTSSGSVSVSPTA